MSELYTGLSSKYDLQVGKSITITVQEKASTVREAP